MTAIDKVVYRPKNEMVDIAFSQTHIIVTLRDGRTVNLPLSWFPSLQSATHEQRCHYENRGVLVNWPDLDDGFSLETVLLGLPDA